MASIFSLMPFTPGISEHIPLICNWIFTPARLASYNLSKDNTFGDFKENGTKEFTVGYQFGAQATLSKFVVNARYEGAFSKDSRKFINAGAGVEGSETEIRYDNRPSMFILGIGYNFK